MVLGFADNEWDKLYVKFRHFRLTPIKPLVEDKDFKDALEKANILQDIETIRGDITYLSPPYALNELSNNFFREINEWDQTRKTIYIARLDLETVDLKYIEETFPSFYHFAEAEFFHQEFFLVISGEIMFCASKNSHVLLEMYSDFLYYLIKDKLSSSFKIESNSLLPILEHIKVIRTQDTWSREIVKHRAILKVMPFSSIKEVLTQLYFDIYHILKEIYFCTTNRDLVNQYRLNAPKLVGELTEKSKYIVETPIWHILIRRNLRKELRLKTISVFEIVSNFSTSTSRIDYFLNSLSGEDPKLNWPFEFSTIAEALTYSSIDQEGLYKIASQTSDDLRIQSTSHIALIAALIGGVVGAIVSHFL